MLKIRLLININMRPFRCGDIPDRKVEEVRIRVYRFTTCLFGIPSVQPHLYLNTSGGWTYKQKEVLSTTFLGVGYIIIILHP